MDAIKFVALAAIFMPYAVLAAKKILRTASRPDNIRKSINSLIPLVLGIIVGTIKGSLSGLEIFGALVVGITEGAAAGGIASVVRDADKNIFHIAKRVLDVLAK